MEPVVEPAVEMPQMSAYGVARETWDGLPWSWAAERLGANRNYWVVTVSPAGQPHAMPVWGVWNAERNMFAFSCAPTARKLRNLMVNPLVSIANADTVECVSVQGVARLLASEEPGREDWISRYCAKYGAEVPGDLAEFVRSGAVIEVHPEVAFGMIESEAEFSSRATRWRFPGT